VPHAELPEILHSWKSFTAKEANKLLRRSGDFWQAEYNDHLIRDEADLRHPVRYVLDNPIKAGLKNWKWVGVGKAWYGHPARD
jgi:REP element-mobilizing transposase RayT